MSRADNKQNPEASAQRSADQAKKRPSVRGARVAVVRVPLSESVPHVPLPESAPRVPLSESVPRIEEDTPEESIAAVPGPEPETLPDGQASAPAHESEAPTADEPLPLGADEDDAFSHESRDEGAPADEPFAEEPPRKRKISAKRVLGIIFAALLVAAVASAGVCAWMIWFRYDDAADIQGRWQSSAGAAIEIDSSQIHLTDTVSYPYSLDTRGKEITYSFQQASGHATYRFSADRNTLVIDEESATDWLVVLGAKDDPALTGHASAGVTILTRTS